MNATFIKIVTHVKPHLDEIAGIWLLQKFGEKTFPGISSAEIIVQNNGGKLNGKSAEDFEKEGTLLIGIGRGRFDEHPSEEQDRKEGECAASLVAKAIGIERLPELQKTLRFVIMTDLRGGQTFDLASMVKLMNEQHPNDYMKVINWTISALEAKYQEQLRFWSAAKEIEEHGSVENVIARNGKKFRLVVCKSDHTGVNQFARSKEGYNASVVIQKRSSGNVQIFSSKKLVLPIDKIAAALRQKEQRINGHEIIKDLNILFSEGTITGAEEWFYHHEGRMMLNGSLTAIDVPPTKIPLEEIVEIVKEKLQS